MKRHVAVAAALAAVFVSVVLPTSVFSQISYYQCIGPYMGCTTTCCWLEDGCYGTCVNSNGDTVNFQSEKNYDLGQNGCIPNSDYTCNNTSDTPICKQVYFALNYCYNASSVCTGYLVSDSCTP